MLLPATFLAGCLCRLDAQLLDPAGWQPAARPRSWLRISPRGGLWPPGGLVGRREPQPTAIHALAR
jgi:hypothetical protein